MDVWAVSVLTNWKFVSSEAFILSLDRFEPGLGFTLILISDLSFARFETGLEFKLILISDLGQYQVLLLLPGSENAIY